MNKKILAIYHKDCNDGTSAAAVVLKKFPNAKLFSLAHSYTPEDIKPILDSTFKETEVYTVDCGLGIRELLDKGNTVTTIDHHIGAKDLFEGVDRDYENYSYIFDNDKSGASLAWSYFFPDKKEPELIKYVEDCDLWKWEYGNDTKHVNNYLSMFQNDPETVLRILEGSLAEIKEKGAVISQYADKKIEKLIETPSVGMKIGDHIVPAFNITAYQSACGNILSEKLHSVVAMFTIEGKNVNLSFRSKEHQSPTSLEIAQNLGGGGHKCAAGANINLEAFLETLA